MSDTAGSGPGRRSSYAGSASVPRRLSYASVVTGTQTNTLSNPTRSGVFAQSMAALSGNSYPPQYQPYGRDYDMAGRPPFHRRGLSSSSQRPVIPAFWVPPYLENSRYARKLQDVYEARVRALREQDASAAAIPGSIWSRPSHARIAPSHRGMTYDIIESNPPPDDDIIPLPTRLSNTDKHQGLDILGDGCEVKYTGVNGKDLEAASIRSDYPLAPQCGIYYYEITIKPKSKDCAVAIGFSTTSASLERLPGWEPQSWAYHGDDGKIFEGQAHGHEYRPGFGQNDVVGCGIDFNKHHAFFTKNGQDLGVAFKDIKFPPTPIFPCIGMKKHHGVQISVNFGQEPFVFDIKGKMTEEEERVAEQIARTRTTKLHRDHPNEASFMQELVAQFLSHGGYIETARAFSQQVQNERKVLHGDESSLPELQNPDASDAKPRQHIRQAILRGDIDDALSYTDERFPGVLAANPQILFQLKCRKFIELVLRAAEIDKSRDSLRKSKQSSNGAAHAAVDDVFDQAMELDDEHESSMNGNGKTPAQDAMSMSEDDEYIRINREMLEYGRVLREEYRDKSQEHEKYLHDIFSLITYYDPSPSQNGHLLDASGRTKVAEDLNSAILTSLGRVPTAAVETMWRQTEALIEVLSQDGGPASFVNLQAEVRDG